MGDWLKAIVSSKKVKDDGSKKLKKPSPPAKSGGFKLRKKGAKKRLLAYANGIGVPVEDVAATRIQTAYRAYKARRTLRRLKGTIRLQALTQNNSVKRQSISTISHLHTWSKIQAEVRARRVCMVTEGRRKQKKLDNQVKLDAKLHEAEEALRIRIPFEAGFFASELCCLMLISCKKLNGICRASVYHCAFGVEWNSGFKTMDEILAMIHQREEASVKRERAMAYAFSHQWRADCNHNHGPGDKELSKATWVWSWKDRWIAARPWESRVPPISISPMKQKSKQIIKAGKNKNSPTEKISVSPKSRQSNGNGSATKPRRLSYPASEKPAAHKGNIKPEEANMNKINPRRLSYPAADKPGARKGNVKPEEASMNKITPRTLSDPAADKPVARKANVKSDINAKKVAEKPTARKGSVLSEKVNTNKEEENPPSHNESIEVKTATT
ncbi:hypothetical protein ACFE04_002633 [Oxalis oulophora]